MFHFFVPVTKVQKDRAIMRETDARVAKYSRRGLILNFIVFVLCLAFGDFQEKEHNLAIVLVTGLLLVTLVRSYYLFRFDTLYARAPTRWRNQYFFASCLGAAWWSVILVTLTWVQGMRDVALFRCFLLQCRQRFCTLPPFSEFVFSDRASARCYHRHYARHCGRRLIWLHYVGVLRDAQPSGKGYLACLLGAAGSTLFSA
jgi:hypothetical protein